MNRKITSNRQAGFTLIELLVGLALLTLLALAVSGAFDGSRSRAQSMIANMTEVSNGNVRVKNDTGCYVNRPSALYNQTDATTSNFNYCGRDFTSTWNGPYVSRFSVDADGKAKLDKIGAQVVVSFERENGGFGGTGKRYFVRAANVPNDIIKQAMLACNDSDNMGATFDNNRCRGELGNGATEVGTFDMLYDETR